MKVKLTDSDKPFEFGEIVVDTIGYLNICAHCRECLKQIVADPNKLNVVLFYRDDEGTIKEWKPKRY